VSVRLVREIGRWDLVGVGINAIIGAGIFGLPARIYELSGPAALIAYAICGVACLLISLCFAEVSSRFSDTGGPYLYARAAFGPMVGFEIGWLRWLGLIVAFAANVNLLVVYTRFIWPIANDGASQALFVTAIVVGLTAINVLGIRQTTIASNIFALAKLLPLLIFVGIGLFFVEAHKLAVVSPPTFGGFTTSVVLVLYAFTGFEAVTITAGEIRDPQRTLPFGLFATLAIVTSMYILIQAVYIGTVTAEASAAPLADAGRRFLGSAGAYLISVGAIVSIVGNLNGKLLAAPRLIFAMAERQQLPGLLGAVHERLRTPYVSIIVSAALALAFALSSTFIQLVTISVLVQVITYAVCCASLPVLRRKAGVPAAAFRSPFGPAIAVTSLSLCAWLLSNSSVPEMMTTAAAAAVGALAYAVSRIRPQRDRVAATHTVIQPRGL
jgi:basic amino acid/polyamine antiporter, APA family